MDSLHNALSERFKCLETNDVLKAASKIVDARSWPDDQEDLATHGNADLQVCSCTVEHLYLLI